MTTVCPQNQCTGCMACKDVCPKQAITIQDDLESYNAIIQQGLCIHCNACYKVCPQINADNLFPPQEWWEGWTKKNEIRKRASSGGAASAIAAAFILNGGVVCSCTFKDGEFGFDFTEDVADLKRFSGSKYVKSNPFGIYPRIKRLLQEGRKVLFIGLPCQVAAVKNYMGSICDNRLYTIDLICHGTPSPTVLEIFIKQHGASLSKGRKITFREKNNFFVCLDDQCFELEKVSDRYSIAFLNSLIYTENCYNCNYSQKNRVGDITLGDSWGSSIGWNERQQGLSLILCQTKKGKEMLSRSDLVLHSVDLENAICHNQQLSHPSIQPRERMIFFNEIKSGKNFDLIISKLLPLPCFKQELKKVLLKLGLLTKIEKRLKR